MTCAAERESMPSIYEGGLSRRFFDPSVEGQGLHDIFDLLLNQLQLLAGAFAIEHPVAPLVGESAVTAPLEILWRELSGYLDCFSDRAARNSAMIRDSHLIARGIAEPQ